MRRMPHVAPTVSRNPERMTSSPITHFADLNRNVGSATVRGCPAQRGCWAAARNRPRERTEQHLGQAGRMTAAEWERVRLHPYFTERILKSSGYLRRLGISLA